MNRLLTVVAALALAASTLAAEPGAVTATKAGDAIEFKVGESLVTRYHVGPKVAKPYFWPVHAPGDVPVTRAWPMKEGEPMETKDHVHQKSMWFCHGDVIPEGVELKLKIKGVEGVDFWSENKNAGRIVCVEVGEPKGGAVATRNEWRTADGQKILDEARTVSVRDLGGARLIVLDIDLHASVCPIDFGDTKEGSMGVRVNDSMMVKHGGHFVTAEGKRNDKEVWGTRSLWCDYVGVVGGKEVGVAVLDDPKNPHPAYWHARGYGLLAANPFGRAKSGFPGQKGNTELVKLAKGEHLKLRYGVLAHTGNTSAGKVADHFEAFTKLRGE